MPKKKQEDTESLVGSQGSGISKVTSKTSSASSDSNMSKHSSNSSTTSSFSRLSAKTVSTPTKTPVRNKSRFGMYNKKYFDFIKDTLKVNSTTKCTKTSQSELNSLNALIKSDLLAES